VCFILIFGVRDFSVMRVNELCLMAIIVLRAKGRFA